MMLSSHIAATPLQDLPQETSASKECVILLHGLARGKNSMALLQKSLDKEGYHTVNLGYPSRSDTIENLAAPTIKKALASCPSGAKIHFVSHSMGGILLRYYLQDTDIKTLGRVVMMGPPNQGSEVVDKLGHWPGYKLFNGPAGKQLGTGGKNIPVSLPSVEFDLGIIAGTKSVNLILSLLIPGTDDGKVSVVNTQVDGMKDHISMPVSHTFMMRKKSVIAQIKKYLKEGKFNHQKPDSE